MNDEDLKTAIGLAQSKLIKYILMATNSNDPVEYFSMMSFLKDNSKTINENYNIDIGGLANGLFGKDKRNLE